MTLTPSEERSIELALTHLAAASGGEWRIERILEDEIRTEPVPEVLATNGSTTAAIEVKELAQARGRQHGIAESLARRLAPTCGGGYSLYLGPWNAPSLDQAFVRHLKREIERVAPALAERASSPIPIPRHATLIYRDAEWKRATCTHDGPFGLLAPLNGSVPGYVFLVDDSIPGHHFVTDEARDRFQASVRRATEDVASGQLRSGVTIAWFEEAELTCTYKEAGEDDGVTVINALVPDAVELPVHADDEVRKALLAGLPKFLRLPRWADRHVLVLEGDPLTRRDDVVRALARAASDVDMSPMDEVLLITGEDPQRVWP